MNLKRYTVKLFSCEFIRWCCVGGVATLIHYGVYFLSQFVINENIAYTIGFAISFIANFYFTAHFTFRVKPSVAKGFGLGLAHFFNYLMHIGLFNMFLYFGVPKIYAPFPVFAIVIPINFILVRFVFKHQP